MVERSEETNTLLLPEHKPMTETPVKPMSRNSSFSSGRATPLHVNYDVMSCNNSKQSGQSTPRVSNYAAQQQPRSRDFDDGKEDLREKGANEIFRSKSDERFYGSMEARASAVVSSSLPLTHNKAHSDNHKSTSSPTRSMSSVVAVEDWNPLVHAQTLLLVIAFGAVWSPNNLMAPNLTQMADYFHFDAVQRDEYLGAHIALATGVLSLPIAGLIGVLADIVHSRKQLFVFTVLLGSFACFMTGYAKDYFTLFIARFINGGCMAGSVPIVFSLLGDLFHAKHRSAASSGFTAMMGFGIIMGQVFAGTTGPVYGWKYPFYVCSLLGFVSAILVLTTFDEPVRGAKEKMLQEILKNGGKYDKKLTWKGFRDAMTRTRSNFLLMIQGFVVSIPWGVMFTFLNDFLSQEQGLSVPGATYLVTIFGFGCAAGGIIGGWLGTVTNAKSPKYLALFMCIFSFLGLFPILLVLDAKYKSAEEWGPFIYSFLAGAVPSMPSVNVRPVLINVNPPELRGASLTAAITLINVARGIGPICLTSMMRTFNISRREGFNILLIVFWTLASIFLLFLSWTIVEDQEKMENELKQYSARAQAGDGTANAFLGEDMVDEDCQSIMSLEERINTFDKEAAKESLEFFSESFQELTGRTGNHHNSPPRNIMYTNDRNCFQGNQVFSDLSLNSSPDIPVNWSNPENVYLV